MLAFVDKLQVEGAPKEAFQQRATEKFAYLKAPVESNKEQVLSFEQVIEAKRVNDLWVYSKKELNWTFGPRVIGGSSSKRDMDR